jgi:hypothetical protein
LDGGEAAGGGGGNDDGETDEGGADEVGDGEGRDDVMRNGVTGPLAVASPPVVGARMEKDLLTAQR